jgi:hypothetical protein
LLLSDDYFGKLNVFLEGNYMPAGSSAGSADDISGYKANGSVTVKVSLK